jgi:C-terminal repeat of topoisomerase
MPPQTLEIRCPKTDQPVLATEKWFTFPGWPDVRCWKLIAKRTMKPEDFIQAFQNGRAELITGFQSKEGKAFDARLVYDAKAKNFSFAFEEKPPGQLVSLQASNTDPTVPSQRPTTTFQTGSKRMQKALVAMKLCRRKGFVIIDAVRYLRRSMASSRRLPLSLL